MTTTAESWGPVSDVLAAKVRNEIRQGIIVVWLDIDGRYTAFVDRLMEARATGQLAYEVQGYRGSYLRLMMALEPFTGGVHAKPLLIHMPGFNEESVQATPLLDAYKAGRRFRIKLSTLITEAAAGKVTPAQIEAFLQQPELTLEGADTWLQSLISHNTDGLEAQLRAMSLPAVMDDLLNSGFVAGRVRDEAASQRALLEQAAAWTGVTEGWWETVLPDQPARPEEFAYGIAAWVLCVEYATDLERAPTSALLRPLRSLPDPFVRLCQQLAQHLRDRHPAFYWRTADETENLIRDEVANVRAEHLSDIDTFRFEEENLLKAALTGLRDGQWVQVNQWVKARREGNSFWLRHDPARQSAWELVASAVTLGKAIAAAGSELGTCHSHDEVAEWYTQRGTLVDMAHRHLEQRRSALLQPQLPEFAELRGCLDRLRRHWRDWADALAVGYNQLCQSIGFLPDSALRQRLIFEQVVQPFARESGATVLFLVDALRYEMGEELYRRLQETPATTCQLKARFAELPTITSVGMNVLAPVTVQGRLSPSIASDRIQGFSAGEFIVSTPETRKRAMHSRMGGRTCPWLSLTEVLERDQASLKSTVSPSRLVVVHCQEIDRAGEQGVGAAVFETILQQLVSAWRLLRDAGARQFVFTADHGFLLLDEQTGTAQSHGRKIDPHRRHTFSTVAVDHPGETHVALADLEYADANGHLVFPLSTAVFDTGKRAMTFVHGGNSLQERLIPVLTLAHRAARGGSGHTYTVTASACEGVAGMHCIKATVEASAQMALDFGGANRIELALRALDAPGVQVDYCQVRGGQLTNGLVEARVGHTFELFFRLTGAIDARVQVELYHPSATATVEPAVPEARFAVENSMRPTAMASENLPATPPDELPGEGWLEQLPADGVRTLFAHLAKHGQVTEQEATDMLGGPRALRRFSVSFEDFAGKAPFNVRIDTVGGKKRYVREGAGS